MTSPSEISPEDVRELGRKMIALLDLAGSPVGVRLLFDESKAPTGARALKHHRYCQVVMKARRGEHVTLDKEGLSYPAAAAAFGFGGPLLDRQGRLLGVNVAHLSEFRAINYGIPIRIGQQLLEGRGLEAAGPTREMPELVGPTETGSRSSLNNLSNRRSINGLMVDNGESMLRVGSTPVEWVSTEFK